VESGDHGLEHQAHACAACGVSGEKTLICTVQADHTKAMRPISGCLTSCPKNLHDRGGRGRKRRFSLLVA
jgi:hypothetical protein